MIKGVLARAARRAGKRVTLVRYKPGTFRDGLFHAEVDFRRALDVVSVQPVTDAMETTPDNFVKVSSMVLIVTTEKLHDSRTKAQRADELEINGETFVVDSCTDWSHRNLAHFESIASRRDA